MMVTLRNLDWIKVSVTDGDICRDAGHSSLSVFVTDGDDSGRARTHHRRTVATGSPCARLNGTIGTSGSLIVTRCDRVTGREIDPNSPPSLTVNYGLSPQAGLQDPQPSVNVTGRNHRR